MVKRYCIVFLLVVLFLLPCTAMSKATAISNDELSYVNDAAGLLQAEQESALEEYIGKLRKAYAQDIVIVTTQNTGGKTSMAYADDYFDEHGYTDHGILLLIDMGNREWWISTKGYCIQAFSDDELASIGDEVADKLKDQTYMDAFETFLRRVDIVLYEYFGEQAEPVFGEMTFSDKFSRWAENISWSLVLAAEAFALILAFLIVGGMKRKMKTARKKALAQEYICENGFKLTRRADIYLYSHTSSRRIERENHPGRSSTHTGSSGKTHGGRGGRF